MVVTLGQQYKVGEKPIDILYTYINRHAGTPKKLKQKHGGLLIDLLYNSTVQYSDAYYSGDVLSQTNADPTEYDICFCSSLWRECSEGCRATNNSKCLAY